MPRPKTYRNYVPPDEGKSYSISSNPNGTSKITDVTKYLQQGDDWTANDANAVWDELEGKLSSGGTAAAASKLATARTIQTNLGSGSAASFNGTANVSPGVTGILSPGNGGTGQTSLQAARGKMGLGNTT